MAKKFLTGLKLVNLPSDPASGEEGELYFNTSASVARIYKSGEWSDLDSAGGGVSLTQEQVQDYVAPLFTNATNTNVVATYDDLNNVINLNTSGSLISVDSITYPDYITLDTTPETSSTSPGTMSWDSGNGTMQIALAGGNVNLQVGQENIALCYNGNGSTLLNGTVVYISGVQGQRPRISEASAASETYSSKTFGVVTEPILSGSTGFVTTFGLVNGINTYGFNSGDPLWLSDTPGQFQSYIPAKPNHMVFIGYVVAVSETPAANNGSIFVNPQNGYELEELHNVLIETPTSGQALVYSNSGSTSLWKNETVVNSINGYSGSVTAQNILDAVKLLDGSSSGLDADLLDGYDYTYFASASHLHDDRYQLLDADLTAIAELTGSQGLLRKSNENEWVIDESEYATESFVSGGYLSITNAQNEYLSLSSASSTYATQSELTNYALTSHNHSLNALENVAIDGGISDGQALVWDSTTSKWINETISAGDSLPVQTGHNGEFLQTDGTTASWAQIDLSSYLTQSSASTTYQPIGEYLTTVSGTVNEIDIVTSSGSVTIGLPNNVTIANDLTISGDLFVNGTTTTQFSQTVSTHDNLIYLNQEQDSAIIGASGDGTYVTYIAENNYQAGMDIKITGVNPSSFNISSGDLKTVYSATASSFVVESLITDTYISGGTAHAKTEANPDLGFAGGYYSSGYAHAGLFRDSTDGVFKFFEGYTPEPDEAVNIDTTHASFQLAPISASTLYLSDALGYQYGGTGLNSLGSAGYVLAVNSTEDGLEWIEPAAGGGAGITISSSPPTSPQAEDMWQDLDTGRMYVYDGTYWVEVQSNGSLGMLRYLGASSTAPIASIDGSALEIGEVYYDTNFNVIKIWNGTSWQDAFSTASLTVNRWKKTVSGGETSLSGNDDTSLALSYIPGIEEVYLNGVKLIRGSDYVATTGTSITGLSALTDGSVVEVITYSSFSVANAYTKAEVDALIATFGSFNSTVTVSGNVNPSATNTYDLGTSSYRWRNIYTQDLHLSNGIGDYTMVEGEEDLFLVNNKTGKSFKFALIEVDSSQVPPKSESN